MDAEVQQRLNEILAIMQSQNNLQAEFKDQIAAAHVLLIGIIRAFADTPGFKENVERTISEIEAGTIQPGAKKQIAEITRRALYRHE